MDALLAFINQIEPWHWAALGLLLLIGEVSTGTTFLLWPAVAAGLAALAAWAGLSGPMQLAIFAVVTLVLTLLGPKYVRGRWLAAKENTTLNERGAQMVGQRGQAMEPFVNGLGAVKLGDTRWRAQSGEAIGAGDAVEVVSADGVTLNVKRV
ncbi:MAG: NfeD family protein [Hyphomonadaceae bacterium]